MANRIKPTPASTSTDGYYVKTEWQTGDVITRPKMMNIEDWLASANDELMLARTGYTANNRKDWTKYQYATIGERMDDMVDYIRRLVDNTDIQKIITDIETYIKQVSDKSTEAIENIEENDTNVSDKADQAISNITNNESSVLQASNTAQSSIAQYDASTSSKANTAKTNIAGYEAAVSSKATAAKTAIDGYVNDVNTYANSTNGKGKKEIDSLVSQVTASKNAAITSINNDKNSVSNAKNSAETAITKYIDNETPAAGETEGVKQVSEQAIEEIEDLVEQVKKSILVGGIYPATDSFTIPVNGWTGNGPYTYEKTYSSIHEEYNPSANVDETSYSYLNSSLKISTNANGKITITTAKKPSGAINIKIILQKVEAI